jgi:hypothetical protein
MDAGSNSTKPALVGLFLALVVAGLIGVAVYLWNTRAKAPSIQGFYGGAARGVGAIDCLHTSSEAAALSDMFHGRLSSTEEGEPDLREFTLLLSKVACFKKDLTSPSGIVEATRYQEYRTSLDLEPTAETVARCFAKTIPPRDLELTLEKWQKRGGHLLRRLCVSFDLTAEEIKKAESLFKGLIRDIADIARGACLKGKVEIAGKPGPRDAHPMMPPELEDLRPYDGYY